MKKICCNIKIIYKKNTIIQKKKSMEIKKMYAKIVMTTKTIRIESYGIEIF